MFVLVLMEKFKNLVQQWVHQNLDAVIVMSNDLDSLISSCMYSYLTGYPITYFYDFESMSGINPSDTREKIFIDIAVKYGKGFDNHVMRWIRGAIVNKEAVNFNALFEISNDNYFDKYAMSTLVIMYAVFQDRIPLPQSELGKMIVLVIDSGYLGYYDEKYHDVYVQNLEKLGLTELIDVLERHSLDEFNLVSQQLKEHCGEKFYLSEATETLKFSPSEKEQAKSEKILSKLSKLFGFPIALPKDEFAVIQLFEKDYTDTSKVEDLMKNPKVFSYAFTGKDKIAVSYIYPKDLRTGA